MCGFPERFRETAMRFTGSGRLPLAGGAKLSAEDGFSSVHDSAPAFQRSALLRTSGRGGGRAGRQHEAYQHSEHNGFYLPAPQDAAGKHPDLGQKEPGGSRFPRGIPGGAPPCPARAFYYDEYSVEGQLFSRCGSCGSRRILDEELYGMESVKQRIIETIIQINRTHTLPAYGLFAHRTGGYGKIPDCLRGGPHSEASLDDAGHEFHQRPGTAYRKLQDLRQRKAWDYHGRLFRGPGSPAWCLSSTSWIRRPRQRKRQSCGRSSDAADNLGFTDNYMECMIPTTGVYPIATANEKDQISAPLMSRFAVIEIPDYTPEEKKVIFSRYALPKVLKRMGMRKEECTLTKEGLETVIELPPEYQRHPGSGAGGGAPGGQRPVPDRSRSCKTGGI